ncbi:cytochrome p450 domain-containing protein [Phthorimaea operculella]|nr:cytochrome p450 domain-containing protein [Phthorimaea operculella]
MLEYILAATLLVTYCVFRWRYRRLYQLAKTLGEDSRTLPIVGVAHLFVGGRETLMKSLQSFGETVIKNKGVVSAWLGHHFFVVVADPVLAEHVAKECLEKDDIMKKCLKPALGNCNFNAPVPIWRVRRKNLVPLFRPKNLKQYERVFTEQSNILADKLRPSVQQPVELYHFFMRYTLETLYQTVLGLELNVQNTPHHPFTESLHKITFLIGERFLKPWLQVECFYKLTPAYRQFQKIMDYANGVMDEINQFKRKEIEARTGHHEDPKEVKCIGEQMMEVGYSDQELREEALSVSVAGVDTSAVTAGFVTLMLARHPYVQDKLYAELSEVFEKDELVTTDHLPRLKYLDAVIKETLRLFPPVPVVTRQTDKDCKLPSGVVLPAGCGILLHLWAMNRHPQYWGPDANQFRPERFLSEGPEPHEQPAQSASFSLGPRNCVGYKFALMSLTTLFATLLRRYRILPATTPGKESGNESGNASKLNAEHDLRLSYGVTVKDADNCTVILQLREGFE